MKGYLGEKVIKIEETQYKNYTPKDWALFFITLYGGFDGGHHKDWVLDQVAQVLNGTKVIIKEASWSNGKKELRAYLDVPSKAYIHWVDEITGGNREMYSKGIAP
jgi:hypothetical protein